MKNVAVARGQSQVARPLKILVPLIQDELAAADEAGLEHYCRAGEMLIEAREQVTGGGWGKWLSQNFALSRKTAWRYMTLAEHKAQGRVVHDTIHKTIGERLSDSARRAGAHVQFAILPRASMSSA